jgi:hypothetical protein
MGAGHPDTAVKPCAAYSRHTLKRDALSERWSLIFLAFFERPFRGSSRELIGRSRRPSRN